MTVIQRQAGQKVIQCHKLVAETAKGMAHEIYDAMMKRDDLFGRWKAQNEGASPRELELRFVTKLWPTLIDEARANLTRLLSTPINESLKSQIYDALILDNSLVRRATLKGGVA